MKIYRFLEQNRVRIGVGENDRIWRYDGPDAFHVGKVEESRPLPATEAKLLPPVLPSKIVAVGRNYAEHAKELGNEAPSEPIIFLKPPTALLAPGGTIVRPPQSQRVDFEGELAIVISHDARNVRREDWRSYVLGFTCANDVTARDLQKKDVQFTRGKGFDTFCPIGPCIETDLDPSALAVQTRVNGEVRQDGNTSQMIFPCDFLIEFISSVMTLLPGDVILTGTPAGVGPMAPGDTVEVEIERIGTLRNVVA
ncbi:MAG TPA: fumarylacetoacetate hydrolase family protein [Thermoanaerobaculia bacterium]|nr:fumarylacetoacetate hydrolase family protein [Thermoanaerobaculia bacterium]